MALTERQNEILKWLKENNISSLMFKHQEDILIIKLKNTKEKEFSSQMIQPPIILTLNLREEEVLKNNRQVFEKLGFEIEHFGGKEYSVYAVPANLYGIAQKERLVLRHFRLLYKQKHSLCNKR